MDKRLHAVDIRKQRVGYWFSFERGKIKKKQTLIYEYKRMYKNTYPVC